MSTKRQQRQKKSNERFIPIQLEEEIKSEEQKESTEPSNTTSSNIKPSYSDILNKSSETKNEENICPSVSKLEIVDEERDILKDQDLEIKIPERMLPPYNVPEKIIIILDRAEDEMSTYFQLNNGSKVKPLNMLKDSLKFFLHNKSSFDSRHEFALITLDENSATWVHDFTSDVQHIIKELDFIYECETEDIFDMATVFDLINEKIKVPTPSSDLIIPPPFIVRAVFLYNRSITMPQIEMTEEISNLLNSPYFTFDVTMTHEDPDSSNKCNLIFKELQQLDTKGFAYFFSVWRNASLLYVAMAKLVSHPLQRCAQNDANYKLN